jgi:hypothetical protein
MRRGSWILPVLLIGLVAAWASWIRLGGKAYLPRHTSARDLPYALARPDVPPQPFNRAMTDPMNLILPDHAFAKRELEAGRVPLWNHGILAGVPHAANPITATFYPPNLLVAFFDPLDFLLFTACLHVVLAGVFFQLWLGAAGLRPSATIVGALGFALCGWMAAHLHNTPLAAVVSWIPLGLAGVEWAASGRTKRGVLAIAISVAMQWVAGFPQFAVIGTLTLAVHALASMALARGAGSVGARARTGGWILAAAVLGLMLAWVQIHPTLDVRGRAPRQGATRAVLLDQALAPGALSGAALPRWLGDAHEKPVTEPAIEGDPDHGSRLVAATLVLGRKEADRTRRISPINSFGERTLYAGAPVLLLAACGLLTMRRRAGFALLAAAAAAAAFALGALPPDPVLRALGLNVGAPGRAILVIALAVPAFAAFGLDRLLDSAPGRASGPWIVLRALAAVFGLGGAAAAAAAWIARDATLGAAVRALHALGAPAALGIAGDRPDSEPAAALGPAFDRLRRDLLVLALGVLAAWAALEWARRALRRGPDGDRRAFRLAIASLVVLVAADLGAFFLSVNRPVLRDGLFPATPAIEHLRKESARSRFARVSPDAPAAVGDMHVLLPPNVGMMHELRDAQGYRDLVPPRTLRLLDRTSAMLTTGGAAGVGLAQAGSPVLDLLAARWLVAARPLDESSEDFRKSGLRRFDPEGAASRPVEPLRDVVLYENPDALPLAFAVHEAAIMEDDEALEKLRSGSFDPRRRVILESMPSQARTVEAPAPGADDVGVRFDGDAIRVDATLAAPGFVVVGEAWDPGWRATLWHGPWTEDRGNELEIARANVAFMAVWVPAGRHTIELRYWPTALTVGIVVSACGALGLAVLLLRPRRRRAAPPVPAPPPSPAPPEIPPSPS